MNELRPDIEVTNKRANFRFRVDGGIYLSELQRSDKHALVEHLNDKDVYDRMLRIPYPYGESDADQFIDYVAELTAKNGYPVHFAIRNEDDKLIGWCGFDNLVVGHQAEIGYWLAKSRWGQGIMTDVVREACEYAMAEWKLVRLSAYVSVVNAASARVLEKNGFQREGLLRKNHKKDGNFIDTWLYALVR